MKKWIFALIFVSLISYFVQYRIVTYKGESMAPTLSCGEKVVVQVFGNSYERGDIIAFKIPNSDFSDPYTLSRIVAMEGDVIELKNKQFFINTSKLCLSDGKELDYTTRGKYTFKKDTRVRFPILDSGEIAVPPDHVFVIGDNPNKSFDSRYWGSLPRQDIRGKVKKKENGVSPEWH